jgi:hypothetical protein
MRIPEPLWAAAVKAAGRHGVHQTARALRLDYYSLKRRVEREAGEKAAAAKGAARAKGPAAKRRDARKSGVGAVHASAGTATFVELPAPAWAVCGECVLELERPGGATMRVHLKGLPASDVVAIGRGLWQVQP